MDILIQYLSISKGIKRAKKKDWERITQQIKTKIKIEGLESRPENTESRDNCLAAVKDPICPAESPKPAVSADIRCVLGDTGVKVTRELGVWYINLRRNALPNDVFSHFEKTTDSIPQSVWVAEKKKKYMYIYIIYIIYFYILYINVLYMCIYMCVCVCVCVYIWWLINNRNLFLTVQKTGSPRQSHQYIRCLVRDSFLLLRQPCFHFVLI